MNYLLETALQSTLTVTDSGTLAATFAASGSDGGAGATDAGTLTFAFAAAGSDQFLVAGSGATILRDRHHNIVHTG